MYHYTYKISSNSGKYYVGRHSTNNLNDGYMGSGIWPRSIKDKSQLTKEILCFYESEAELKIAEGIMLQECIDDPLNMNWNNSSAGWATGSRNPNYSPERRAILSERMRGDKNPMKAGHTEAAKKKISKAVQGERNSFFGKNHTDETRASISNTKTGVTYGEEFKQKFRQRWEDGKYDHLDPSKNFLGKEHSEESKRKIGDSWKKREKKVCPHCDIICFPNTFTRWHGENCKHKVAV
jgi:hypothetical protein